MLLLPAPQQGQPMDLGQVLGDVRADPPQAGLVCQGQGLCIGQRIPSILVPTAPAQTMFLHLARNLTGAGAKILSPVMEPVANQPEWPGMELRVVLAHSAHPDHWRAFVKVGGVWWCVDSTRGAIRQENPFINQVDPIQTDRGYTVDVVIFSA